MKEPSTPVLLFGGLALLGVGWLLFVDSRPRQAKPEQPPPLPPGPTPLEPPGMGNPAATNCLVRGGRLMIRDTPSGQTGECLFPDGSSCEAWALFRGQCDLKTGAVLAPPPDPFGDPIGGSSGQPAPVPPPINVRPLIFRTISTLPVLTKHLADRFFREVDLLAARLKAKGADLSGEDLLAVFLAESRVSPWARNSIGCAGISQICVLTNFGYHKGEEEYRKLPAEAQLPYFERYVDVNVRAFAKGDCSVLSTLGKLYLLNGGPAFISQPEKMVMHRRDPKGPGTNASAEAWRTWTAAHSAVPGQDVYALNRSLDYGNKGYIEVADMTRFVEDRVARHPDLWNELIGRLEAVRGMAPA